MGAVQEPAWPDPSQQHVAYGDPVAGLYGAAAALVALWGRERLGGSDVELCQVECLFQVGSAGLIAEHAAWAIEQIREHFRVKRPKN